MGKKALLYGTALIGIYLVVVYWTGSGTVITDSTSGAEGVIAAFQGRAVTNTTPAGGRGQAA
jgi:hypothetical protein